MEWNRALAVTTSRLFPALAFQQLIASRRRADRPAPPARPAPVRRSARRAPLATSRGAVR